MSKVKEDLKNAMKEIDKQSKVDFAPGMTNIYVHPSIVPQLREHMKDDPYTTVKTIITPSMVADASSDNS